MTVQTQIKLFGFVLMLAHAILASNDEWYCRLEIDQFQICRKCPKLSEPCEEAPKTCKCQNMRFAKADGSCKFLFSLVSSQFPISSSKFL